MVSDEFCSSRQAADKLRVPLSTFHDWVKAGRLEVAFRIEGKRGPLFFRRSDVEALARQMTEEVA